MVHALLSTAFGIELLIAHKGGCEARLERFARFRLN
jgi:hypothetical protein